MEKSEHSKALAFVIAAFFLGIVFTVLFYSQALGLNIPLFVMLASSCGLLLARMLSRHIERMHYILLIFALFFSSMVFVRSSELLTFFNVVGCALLLLIVANAFTGKQVKDYFPSDYGKLLLLPFFFIERFFVTLPNIFRLPNNFCDVPMTKRTKEIIRGILMSIVAIIVFAWLFASADAVFSKIVSSVFAFQLDGNIVGQVVVCIAVAAFFIGTFAFIFKKRDSDPVTIASAKFRNLGSMEASILLGTINTLFFVFIVLQLSYFFGGESHLVSVGATYAQYARSGFFELNIVAILSYLIISFAEQRIVKKEGVHFSSFKILSGILVAQVVLILISAFTRLSLYEEAYGFTTIRLYSHAFMVWLGIVLILLFYHIRTNGNKTTFAFRAFCTVILLLFAMNILNPDVFIAKKNLERYAKTGHIDAAYLGGLSDDALPYTIHLLDDPNKGVSKDFASGLYDRFCILNDCTIHAADNAWQSARLNRATAEQLLASRLNAIEAMGGLTQAISH